MREEYEVGIGAARLQSLVEIADRRFVLFTIWLDDNRHERRENRPARFEG